MPIFITSTDLRNKLDVNFKPQENLFSLINPFRGKKLFISHKQGLAHATGVHERNSVPYARFALKKRHGFCAKAREKNMPRHRLGTL